ncbi:MAG: porin [Bacteroidetes bacterium]|nr:MAG: porin [Bacteroidota bacterium]
MLRKFFASATLFFVFYSGFTQDSTKKSTWTLTGSVDAYYRYNFDNAKNADPSNTNNLTSFTNSQNSFELGMASLRVDHTMGKVGGTVDLGFGKRAEEFSYNDHNTMAAVKQAFLTYAPSDKIKFTMGKWGTHVGYEVLDAYLNRNYSMDYMFSYGPFFHTGLKMDATFKNVGFMIGVANPADNVTASFAKKSVIGQFSVASSNGKVKGYLNYMGGKNLSDQSINQFDVVVTGTISSKFSIGYNGTVQSVKPTGESGNSWWGSAVYLNLDPTPVFGLTLRGEYFDDKNAVSGLASVVGLGTSVFDATLSANFHIDNLTIIPEFRLDSAKDAVFKDNNDGTKKSTSTFILAATYHF